MLYFLPAKNAKGKKQRVPPKSDAATVAHSRHVQPSFSIFRGFRGQIALPLSSRRVDDRLYLVDRVCRKTAAGRVFAYEVFVRGYVYTIDLVAGHIALHPLYLRAKILEHAARCLRHGV